MSIKTTLTVTRKQIINIIKERLAQSFIFDSLSNTQLEDLAEELDEACGYIFTNYIVAED